MNCLNKFWEAYSNKLYSLCKSIVFRAIECDKHGNPTIKSLNKARKRAKLLGLNAVITDIDRVKRQIKKEKTSQ